jgi:hypothetical protein
MFHGGLWGGWQYQVAGVARKFKSGQALAFGYGGYQEARGSGIKDNHFYLENVLEELDQPGEWYFDAKASLLYYWPNATDAGVTQEVVAPLLDTLISVKGARDITIEGIEFTETRATYLEQYEVPSGGDWSIHRGAAVFIRAANPGGPRGSVGPRSFCLPGDALNSPSHILVCMENSYRKTATANAPSSMGVQGGPSTGVLGTSLRIPWILSI